MTERLTDEQLEHATKAGICMGSGVIFKRGAVALHVAPDDILALIEEVREHRAKDAEIERLSEMADEYGKEHGGLVNRLIAEVDAEKAELARWRTVPDRLRDAQRAARGPISLGPFDDFPSAYYFYKDAADLVERIGRGDDA